MINKIRAYIDHAFKDAPQTKKMEELKEELLGNLIEKYNDHLKNGKNEDEAYTAAISGIGDISELVDNLREPFPLMPETAKERHRSALMVAIAVALYILSAFMVPLFSIRRGDPVIGIFVMFCFIAVATGLLIYNGMTRKQYKKNDDSLVEDFKAYRVNTEREKTVYRMFTSAYWTLVVAVYLLVSFIFGIWAYSWIIFIIAKAIEKIVLGIIRLRGEKNEQ